MRSNAIYQINQETALSLLEVCIALIIFSVAIASLIHGQQKLLSLLNQNYLKYLDRLNQYSLSLAFDLTNCEIEISNNNSILSCSSSEKRKYIHSLLSYRNPA